MYGGKDRNVWVITYKRKKSLYIFAKKREKLKRIKSFTYYSKRKNKLKRE